MEAELAASCGEVEELRLLLDGVMAEKAALASRCSSLEAQVCIRKVPSLHLPRLAPNPPQ